MWRMEGILFSTRIRDGWKNCLNGRDEDEQTEMEIEKSCARVRRHRFSCSPDQPTCLSVTRLGMGIENCRNDFDEVFFGMGKTISTIGCNDQRQDECSLLRECISQSSISTQVEGSEIRTRQYTDVNVHQTERIRPYFAVLHGSILRSFFSVSYTRVYKSSTIVNDLSNMSFRAVNDVCMQKCTANIYDYDKQPFSRVRRWSYFIVNEIRKNTTVIRSHVTRSVTVKHGHDGRINPYMVVNDRGCSSWAIVHADEKSSVYYWLNESKTRH